MQSWRWARDSPRASARYEAAGALFLRSTRADEQSIESVDCAKSAQLIVVVVSTRPQS